MKWTENSKAEERQDIIYLRTSTEEQDPENQLRECLAITQNGAVIKKEQQSAWKDGLENRPIFKEIYDGVKLRLVKSITVWDLDRLYRNRIKTVEFLAMCNAYGVEVRSYRQAFLSTFDKMLAEFDKTNPMYWMIEQSVKQMKNTMIQIFAWIAEEESNKKSDRVKAAIVEKAGEKFSRYGKKWGRPEVEVNVYELVRLRREGMSIRNIADQLGLSKSKVETVLKTPHAKKLLSI